MHSQFLGLRINKKRLIITHPNVFGRQIKNLRNHEICAIEFIKEYLTEGTGTDNVLVVISQVNIQNHPSRLWAQYLMEVKTRVRRVELKHINIAIIRLENRPLMITRNINILDITGHRVREVLSKAPPVSIVFEKVHGFTIARSNNVLIII